MGSGLLVTGYSPGWLGTLAGVLLLGIGHGAVDAGFNSQFVQTYNQGRDGTLAAGKWLNKLHLFFGVGALIGPLLVYALSRGNPWSSPFYVMALFALAIPAVYFLTQRFSPSAELTKDNTRAEQAVTTSLPRALIWMMLLAVLVCFMFGGLETALGGWIYTFLTEGAFLSGEVATYSVSLFWGLLAAGRLLSVWAVSRYGNLRWIRNLAIMLLVALLLGYFAFDRDAATVMVLAGLGLSGIFPTMIAWITGFRPQASARLIATLLTGSTLGAIVVPWLVGEVASAQGLEWSYGLLVAVAALLLGLVLLLAWLSKRHEARLAV